MATPYFPPKPGAPSHTDLPVILAPLVIVDGKHCPLSAEAMGAFVNFIQSCPSIVTDILGESPCAELNNVFYITGQQYMNLIFRVTSVDNLDMIWELCSDQTLDQRVTNAVYNTMFARSVGLQPQQLYFEVIIDEKDYYTAKAVLTPPRARGHGKLAQGSPMYGPWSTDNLSFLPRLQNTDIPIQVVHQNQPQGASNVPHMVEPPNRGQFTPISTAGPQMSSQVLMNPQMPQGQGQRDEPEGHASTYVSMEEEHVAVNFPEFPSYLNVTPSVEPGFEPALMEASSTSNLRRPPGFAEMNPVHSGRQVPQHEKPPIPNTEAWGQPDQSNEVEVTIDSPVDVDDAWETPPNSFQTHSRARTPGKVPVEAAPKDDACKEKRKRSLSRSRYLRTRSTAESSVQTVDGHDNRPHDTKVPSEPKGMEIEGEQSLNKAVVVTGQSSSNEQADDMENKIPSPEEGAGTAATMLPSDEDSVNLDAGDARENGKRVKKSKEHTVSVSVVVTQTKVKEHQKSVSTNEAVQGENESKNINDGDGGEAASGSSQFPEEPFSGNVEKMTQMYKNLHQTMESKQHETKQDQMKESSPSMVETVKVMGIQFFLYIAQDYGKIKQVDLISRHPDMQNILFERDPSHDRIWKSGQVFISVQDKIHYKYQIQIKDGTFERILKVVFINSDGYVEQTENVIRELKMKYVQRDMFANDQITKGHFAFMTIMMENFKQTSVNENLIACMDMKFPSSYDHGLTQGSLLSFVEDQVRKLDSSLAVEHCVFLVAVLAHGIRSSMWITGLKKHVASKLLTLLSEGGNSMLPSESKKAVKNIAFPLCELGISRSSWLDVVVHFFPLLDQNMIMSIRQRCHTTYRKGLDHKEIQAVVRKLCGYPDAGEIISDLMKTCSDLELALDIYADVKVSRSIRDGEKENLLKYSKETIIQLIKSECSKIVNRSAGFQNLTYMANLLTTKNIDIASSCSSIFESHLIRFVDKLSIESAYKITRHIVESIQSVALQNWLFCDDESAFRLLLTFAKSSHSIISDLVLYFLDHVKFRILQETEIKAIALQWMKTCEFSHGWNLRKPKEICAYYEFLVLILKCELVMQNGQVTKILEDQAKEKLLQYNVDDVLQQAYVVNEEASTKIYEHADNSEEDISISAALLGDQEVPLLNSSYQAWMLLRALSGTMLAQLSEVKSFDFALELAQKDILNHMEFWKKLMKVQGSLAANVWSNIALKNMQDALAIITRCIQDGSITVRQFRVCKKTFNKVGMEKAVHFVGECRGYTAMKSTQWEKIFRDSTRLESETEDILNKMELLLSFLQMSFRDEITLIDLDDLEKQLKQCKVSLTKEGSVLLVNLRDNLPAFLGNLAELCSEAEDLKRLRYSGVFLNICHKKLPMLELKDSSKDKRQNISTDEDLQGASILFGNSAEQSDDDPSTDEELEGKTTCKVLAEFLANECVNRYVDIFQGTLFKKKDVSIEQISEIFPKFKEIPAELKFAEDYFPRKLPDDVHRAFDNLLKFKDILKKTHMAESVLDVFGFGDTQDHQFREAVTVAKNFETAEKKENISLLTVSAAYTQIIGALGELEDDHWSLIEELSRSRTLIGYLREIIEEDLRNLVDAVEDSSDQQIQSSTVYDFIQVKQFVKTMIKGFNNQKVADFFILIKKTADGSQEADAKHKGNTDSKNMAAKLKICTSNFFGLKSLYLNMADRGEVTREIIHNSLSNGVIYFQIDTKTHECKVHIRYSVRKEKATYHTSDLEDLRSRAFLLLGKDKSPRESNVEDVRKKPIDFEGFIYLVDMIMDARDLIEVLHNDGHFEFRILAKNLTGSKQEKQDSLKLFCEDLAKKHENWINVLESARSTYYFLNFIYAEQFLFLHDFFLGKEDLEKVAPIFRSIHPDVDVSPSNQEYLRAVYHSEKNNNKELATLISLGEALKKIFGDMKPRQRHFPIVGLSGSQDVAAVVGVNKVYVVKLDADSQNVIPVVMALYASTCHVLPESWQLMFCHENSSWDEIDLLLKRCKFAEENHRDDALFCLANVEHLPGDYLLRLIDELKSLSQLGKHGAFTFRLAVVCRGAMHHPLFDHFSQDTHTVRGLPDRTVIDCLAKICSNVTVVASDVPGMGKSEYISNKAAENNKQLAVMTISGPITRASLVKRLSETKIGKNSLLHLDIADVSDTELLDVFIFELVVMFQVSYRTNLVQLHTDFVAIEIANTLHHYLKDSLMFTTRLVPEKLMWKDFGDFYCAEEEVLSSVQVVCHYLQALDMGSIDRIDLLFRGQKAVKPLPMKQCQHLLGKHFGASGDISFAVCDIFLSVLAQQLRKMSSSVYFSKTNLEAMLGTKEPLQVRSDLVRALIQVCSEFACPSVNSCRASQEAALEEAKEGRGRDTKPLEKQTKADRMANRTQGMIRWEESNHLMIVFHHEGQTVSALYRDLQKVPKQIQSLFQKQLGEPLPNFNEKKPNQLQQILEKLAIGRNITQDKNHLEQLKSLYALTPDNLLKMVLILLRIQARIPVVIMGETGCGKTSLVRSLAATCGIHFDDSSVIPFHAGVTEEDISEKIWTKHREALKNLKTPVWVFLDEINTCEHLGLLCEIICHHSYNGITLSDNLTFVAACNPYRLRENLQSFTAGLEGKIKADEYSKLVYRVHPLPEAMIDYVWDYGTLHEKDEKTYIARMVSKTLPAYTSNKNLVDVLAVSQEFMRNTEATVECVSLRDVDRCRKLMTWFHDVMLKEKAKYSIGQSNYTSRSILTRAQCAVILSLAHCYHSRISNTEQRKEYLKKVSHVMFGSEDKYKLVSETIFQEQMDLLNRMELPDGIAKNTALRENVFVVLVCILQRIPVFVVGKPGSSKSLSLQLLRSNLRGQDSHDDYFKILPQLLVGSYQGSESSTSEGIIKIFEKAKSYLQKSENVLPVVLLDEIGLAEISRFNPLKVLHNLLEPVSGKDPDVAVVGLSNWALDAAKMNRAVHLSRPELDEEELYDTGVSISTIVETSDWLHRDSQKKLSVDENILKALSSAFYEYQKSQRVKNFHGLRDYYSLIKYLSKHLREEILQSIKDENKCMEIIKRGILRNFGGQKVNNILNIFFHYLKGPTCSKEIVVEELISENLDDKEARHLMIITSGGSAMGVLEKIIRGQNRECETIIGSMFDEDQTEDYSYRILSRIIMVMERGCVLILKDLDTIYGSLYDMLNQNYTRIGGKRNCRIALGPFSNPMCHVHEDFRCIVLVDEHKVDYSDPPFLNRFEKQIVRYGDVLTKTQGELLKGLENWVSEASTIEGLHFSPEDCFMGYNKDTLPTLVLQNSTRELHEDDISEAMKICKETLLLTATPAAVVRLTKTKLGDAEPEEVEGIIALYFHLKQNEGLPCFLEFLKHKPDEARKVMLSLWQPGTSFIKQLSEEVKEKMSSLEMDGLGYRLAVYSNSHLLSDYISQLPQDMMIQVEKLSSFKSERQLTLAVRSFWYESEAQLLMLHCKPSLDAEHLQLAKYQIENCRSEFQHSENNLYANKDVCIVVHLDHGEEKPTRQWQFNYLSGWQIVTIDDLEPHSDGETLLDILESDPLEILQSCALPVRKCLEEQMLWAFSCLKHSNCPRAPKETTELIKLICRSDDFMETIIKYVLGYLFAEEEQHYRRRNFMSPESWQAAVSCDASLLSYAATFRSALLSSVIRRVQVPLAKVVFMLDSLSAWHSFFTDLELTEVWKELFHIESWFTTQNVEDPHGLECYHVQDPPLKLIYPFSKVLYKKLEAHLARVQEDLDRIYSDADAVDQFNDLKPEYQDRLVEQFVEFFKNKAPELFNMQSAMNHVEHLINDICNIVSEPYHVNLGEDIRVSVCKWIIKVKNRSSQAVGEYRLIASLLTLWHNHSLMEDVLQLLTFCKSAINKDILIVLWGTLQGKFEEEETYREMSENDETLEESLLDETKSVSTTSENQYMDTGEQSLNAIDVNQDEEDLLPAEILVNNLCSELIPCKEVLSRCGGVTPWQMMVNRLLSFASRISAYPCSLHVLRLCNDYVSMIHLPYNLNEDLLLCLAEKAQKGADEGLDSPDLFKCVEVLMETLGEEGVPWEEIQRFHCQYFGRILDVSAQSDLLSEILATVVSFLNRGRELFVSPILHRLMIYLGNEDLLGIYQHLLYVSPSEADMAEYPSLECLKGHLESEMLATRKTLMILCVDVLHMLLKPIIKETLSEAVEGDHHLLKAYDKAARILTHETEPSLSAAIAAGFIRALHDAFATKLAKGNLATGFGDFQVLTNTVSNALQFGPSEEDPVRRILLNHFLQLIRLRREFGLKHLTDVMNNLSTFAAGKSLPPPVDEVVLSVGYNPLSLVPNFVEHRQAMETFLTKGEKKVLVILVAAAKSSSTHCLSLLANALEKFYLVRALRPLKSGEKSSGEKLCDLVDSLPATVKTLLKCIVGEKEFKSSLLEISPESNIQQVQKAVVLVSCISLITVWNAHSKEGKVPEGRSLFAKCLLDPKQLLDMHVPTCTDAKCPTMTHQLQTWRSIQDCQVFRCKCNRQTCVALGKEMCSTCQISFLHEEEEEDMEVGSQESGLGQMDTSEYHEIPGGLLCLSAEGHDPKICIRKLSPVSFRILQLLLHGILEASVALGITPLDELSQVLGLSQPPVKTFMEDMFSADWSVLQGQLDVSHEDLFNLLNCLIWKLQDVQDNTCCTVQERDTFEEEFDELTKSVIAVQGEVCVQHIQDVTKAADFRSGGIESMMLELPIVEGEKAALPLLSAFRQIHDKTYQNLASQFLSLGHGHKFPFLELYLDYQEQLSLLCNILPIVRWHLKLIACGSHTLQRGDAIQWSAAKFTHLEEQDKHSRSTVFGEFCQAWGRICDKWSVIQAIDPGVGEPCWRHGGIELRECIMETMESEIFKVLLVLQKIQNEFLEKTLKIAAAKDCLAVSFLCAEQGISQLPVVPLQSVIKVHVIDTVWEESILTFAQWDTRYGYGKILNYNFGKVEEELANLLVLGKAYLCLDDSFPLFSYAGELFRSNAALIDGLKEVIPQRILPPKIQGYVHQMRNSNPEYPQNLLHNLEVILYFLRKFEPRKDITVQDFIDKWLEGTMAQSAKVELPSSEFELLCVCHVVSLLEFLEELQGHAIIESLHEKFRKVIPGHLEEKLTAFEKNSMYPRSSLVSALSRFIFRWFPTLEKQREMSELEPLGKYLDDVTLWPHRVENEGLLQNEDLAAFNAHFPKELTLQHLYCIFQRVNMVSEEKKKAEKLAAPVFKARPGRRTRIRGGQIGRT